jgi:hypothetical protein
MVDVGTESITERMAKTFNHRHSLLHYPITLVGITVSISTKAELLAVCNVLSRHNLHWYCGGTKHSNRVFVRVIEHHHDISFFAGVVPANIGLAVKFIMAGELNALDCPPLEHGVHGTCQRLYGGQTAGEAVLCWYMEQAGCFGDAGAVSSNGKIFNVQRLGGGMRGSERGGAGAASHQSAYAIGYDGVSAGPTGKEGLYKATFTSGSWLEKTITGDGDSDDDVELARTLATLERMAKEEGEPKGEENGEGEEGSVFQSPPCDY